ncbi:MAG: NUDIX hydrolase [Chloroflexi bacterium]|nr:NUDIX hydrolase [Chloroflexota bacterium]
MIRERVIQSERVFRGRVLSLRVDTVVLDKGGPAVQTVREVVEHGPSVVVVPVDDERRVLLVRQYRLAADEMLLEAPAGGIEEGEEVEQAVLRELREEAGVKAEQLVRLGGFWTTPGFCNEFMHAYLAQGLQPSPLGQDPDEDVHVIPVPIAQVPDLIRKGEIRDAKTIAALLIAFCLFGLEEAKEIPR